MIRADELNLHIYSVRTEMISEDFLVEGNLLQVYYIDKGK